MSEPTEVGQNGEERPKILGPTTPPPPVSGDFCTYCGSQLKSSGAKYCSVCSHYTTPIRNELKYWGGLTSVASLFAAAVSFSLSYYHEASSRFFGKTIEVIDFDSTDFVRILNPSSNAIIITEIEFSTLLGPTLVQLPLSTAILPGKVVRISVREQINKSIGGEVRDWLGGPDSSTSPASMGYVLQGLYTPYTDVNGITPPDWKKRFVFDFLAVEGGEYRSVASINKMADADNRPNAKIVVEEELHDSSGVVVQGIDGEPQRICSISISYTKMPFGEAGKLPINCALSYRHR
jgi:hypothetical protein